MRSSKVWRSATALLLAAALFACDKGPGDDIGGPYNAAPPAHPAMRAPVAATSSGGRDPHAGMAMPPARSQPGSGSGSGSASLSQGLARFGLAADVPDGWTEAGGGGMRLATLKLPRVEGDSVDGEMSVIPAGGSVNDNIVRWQGQFAEKPAPQTTTLSTEGGIDVTVVVIEGTFSAGGMGRGSAEPRPDTILLGAVVEAATGGQHIFFKAWGPRRTMEHWKESFTSFASSMRRSP